MFNPVFYHAWDFLHDTKMRTFFALGGSRSGKTYSIAQSLLMYMLHHKVNIIVFRKTRVSIKNTVYNDFKDIIRSFGMWGDFFCSDHDLYIRHVKTGCVIEFFGIDDAEKIKGISKYAILFNNELTAMDYADYKQQQIRFGGKSDLKLVNDFNPIDELHWIKSEIFDKTPWTQVDATIDNGLHVKYTQVIEKHINKPQEIDVDGEKYTVPPNTMFVKTCYKQNFWIVGSPIKGDFGLVDVQYIALLQGFREKDYNFYRIYAEGDWGKAFVGYDFYRFDIARDTIDTYYNNHKPLYLSFDENSLPYMACTIWQGEGKDVMCIDEVCLKSPYNNVDHTVREIHKRYPKHNSTIYICGDATSKKRSTLLKYGENWYSVIIDLLLQCGYKEVISKVMSTNYSVKLRGTFVNKIFTENYLDLSIKIDKNCKELIKDLKYVQEAKDGTKLKELTKDVETRAVYQKLGHCFVGETMITTGHGRKRIDEIKKGEYVMTRFGFRKVKKVFENGFKNVNTYSFVNKNRQIDITCTSDHRIRINNTFPKISQFNNGDRLTFLDDDDITITTERFNVIVGDVIKRFVYDLEVEEDHEYIANQLVVHNCSDSMDYFLTYYFNSEYLKFASSGGFVKAEHYQKLTEDYDEDVII